tara:strand:- start:1209 stop:1523 length:315 start_codon:yes stop_codon:yes gene_type:complete
MLLLGKKPWTDYEWAKRTGITRATFGNNRKNNGENIKANTLEAMAKACGQELRQDASDQAIRPNSKDARFSLLVVNNSIQILERRIKDLEEENERLKEFFSKPS